MTQEDEAIVETLMRQAAAAIEAVRQKLGSDDDLLLSRVMAVAAGVSIASATWASPERTNGLLSTIPAFVIGGASNHHTTLLARSGCVGTA